MCDRVVVLYMGRVMEVASCKTIFEDHLHPYSESLINAIPIPDPEKEAQKRKAYRIIMSKKAVRYLKEVVFSTLAVQSVLKNVKYKHPN